MAKAKATEPKTSLPKPAPRAVVLLAWLLFGPPRGYVWTVIAVVVFIGLGGLLWRSVSNRVMNSPEYLVTSHRVEITPPPQWIRSDIAAEVVRSLSLDAPLSILDDQLSQRMYDGFAAHPWVAQVERVAKRHPAHVRVDLVYRRPVCVVEVAARPLPGGVAPTAPNLLPVDVKGVLLPHENMPESDRVRYPRLVGIVTSPLGPPGVKWGDARVTGGAEVAAALVDVWSELSLDRILPSQSPERGPRGDEYSFEIFTTGGTRILWGHSPSTLIPGEVPVSEKIARLRKLRQLHGDQGPKLFDVREWRQAKVMPLPERTVQRPSANQAN